MKSVNKAALWVLLVFLVGAAFGGAFHSSGWISARSWKIKVVPVFREIDPEL